MDNRILQIQQRQAAQHQVNDRQYRLRTAALEKESELERLKQAREREIVLLLNEGYSADKASYILEIPPSEVGPIEEYNQRRRKFLMTGNLDLAGKLRGVKYPPPWIKKKSKKFTITRKGE